jgi:uncharacterized cupredoxin-like copper-binding protein
VKKPRFAHHAVALLVAAGLVLFVAAGCAGGDGTAASPTANPAGSPTGSSAGQVVEVRLSEYKIEMPSSVPTGSVTFRVTNDGQQEHSFEVEGQATESELEANLAPGQSQTLTVDLQAGSYEFYCPVDGHRDLGMLVEGSAQ